MSGQTVRESPLKVLGEPVEPILGSCGLEFSSKQKGDTTWYNLKVCPVCDHKGYQCGVSESDKDGRLIHGVKCQHEASPRYEEFLELIGAITSDELHEIQDILDRRRNGDKWTNYAKRTCGSAEHRQACHNRLLKHAAALKYLTEVRGISQDTIKEFSLGLSQPYEVIDNGRKTGIWRKDALVCPVRQRDGSFSSHYYYYAIPGVTVTPLDKNGWGAKGLPASTYYSDPVTTQRYVVVLEGMKDLWRVKSSLRCVKWAKEFAFVTSTHGSSIPAEWNDQDFWRRWDGVFLGQDSDVRGDAIAQAVFNIMGRPARRVTLPADKRVDHKDWTDFFNAGGTAEQFKSLLDTAPEVKLSLKEDSQEFGLVACRPLDNVTLSYHEGHMYYTVRLLNREPTGKDMVVERYETRVVRSDGRLLTASESPAPPGTPEEQRVIRLSDGTLIAKRPQQSMRATWSLRSILEFVSKQGKVLTRPLAALVRSIREHLRGTVWFRDEDNYTLLAFAAVVTYVQEIFDSVPLVFLNGSAGTGKSQAGRGMHDICCNSVLSGKASAATLTRLIDGSRGFVTIDDLETVGGKSDTGLYSDIVQILKVSYNKHTALRQWTDSGKGYSAQELNFYGVKLVNNTRGIDKILGTRMLRINTFPIPNEAVRDEFNSRKRWIRQDLDALRDELHTWAFSNVRAVEDAYRRLYPAHHTDRQEEISAPLLVLADVAGDLELAESLHRALERQKKVRDAFDPIDTLKDAIENLIKQGYSRVTINHVCLEMRAMFDPHFGQDYVNEVPEWARPEWIGRQLRQLAIVDFDAELKRIRLYGKFVRILPISAEYLDDALARFEREGVTVSALADALSFCKGCPQCGYRMYNCDIMPARMEAEKHMPSMALEGT